MNPTAGSPLALAVFAISLVLIAASSARSSADLFKKDDTIVFVGGSNSVDAQFQGYLEALITVAHPGLDLRFRNMAWECDTVHFQQRPLNFPDWNTQLKSVGADVLIVSFGQLESLDGPAGISDFEAGYRALLDKFSARARTIILVSPPPFEAFPFLSPAALSTRNENLRAYTATIEKIAADRGTRFVDLQAALENESSPRTSNGVHLTGAGQLAVARATAAALDIPNRWTPAHESLREAIVEKNRLWHRYWRPTNWAFLHGDRTHVQSSRDHRDMEIRWFPTEVEQYLPLIRNAETRIQDLASPFK